MISAILAAVVILVSILCGCLGGVRFPFGKIGIFNCFDFGEGSAWKTSLDALKAQEGGDMGTFFQCVFGLVVTVVMLAVLLAMVIRAILTFVKGRKTGDYTKLCNSAIIAYLAFLGGQVATLFLYSAEGFSLQPASIAGAVIGGVLVGAMLVLRLLADGKKLAEKNAITHIALVVAGIVGTVVVLALTAEPLLGSVGYIYYLSFANAGGTIPTQVLMFGMVGMLFGLLLILLCTIQLAKYFKRLGLPVKEKRKLSTPMSTAIVLFMFALSVALAFPMNLAGVKVGTANQIVLLVFAAVNFGVALADHIIQKKSSV